MIFTRQTGARLHISCLLPPPSLLCLLLLSLTPFTTAGPTSLTKPTPSSHKSAVANAVTVHLSSTHRSTSDVASNHAVATHISSHVSSSSSSSRATHISIPPLITVKYTTVSDLPTSPIIQPSFVAAAGNTTASPTPSSTANAMLGTPYGIVVGIVGGILVVGLAALFFVKRNKAKKLDVPTEPSLKMIISRPIIQSQPKLFQTPSLRPSSPPLPSLPPPIASSNISPVSDYQLVHRSSYSSISNLIDHHHMDESPQQFQAVLPAAPVQRLAPSEKQLQTEKELQELLNEELQEPQNSAFHGGEGNRDSWNTFVRRVVEVVDENINADSIKTGVVVPTIGAATITNPSMAYAIESPVNPPAALAGDEVPFQVNRSPASEFKSPPQQFMPTNTGPAAYNPLNSTGPLMGQPIDQPMGMGRPMGMNMGILPVRSPQLSYYDRYQYNQTSYNVRPPPAGAYGGPPFGGQFPSSNPSSNQLPLIPNTGAPIPAFGYAPGAPRPRPPGEPQEQRGMVPPRPAYGGGRPIGDGFFNI